jgi:hypothetical protein
MSTTAPARTPKEILRLAGNGALGALQYISPFERLCERDSAKGLLNMIQACTSEPCAGIIATFDKGHTFVRELANGVIERMGGE